MLGKQGWKIFSNSDAIISLVLKAKYFSNGDFLDSKLGHNPGIWRMKIPQKIKIFLWRVCRNILPMRCNLQVRGVEFPATCVCCFSLLENAWHYFLMCPGSVQTWKHIGLWGDLEPVLNRVEGFAEFFFYVSRILDNHKRSLFAWTLWSMWRKRNIKIWEDKEESYVQVSTRALNAMEEWNS